MRSFFNFKKGFTLIELVVAMAIMSIIISVGINAYRTSLVATRDQRRKADLALIAGALESYKANNIDSSYPNTTYSGLCQGSSTSLVPNYLTKLPWDPSSTDPCKPGGGTTNSYTYTPSCSGTICKTYVLSATLEGLTQNYTINQNGIACTPTGSSCTKSSACCSGICGTGICK